MNVKEKWIDEFMEKLWEYHTCDWEAGNKNPNYPFQLASAYFDWDFVYGGETAEEAFNRYLENLK